MRTPRLSEIPPPPPGKTGWPWTEETPPPETMPGDRALPRVSIITPSFNQGRFIEETIRSVLLQGYPNLEYIIIDGGSTDDSLEIIRKYERWLSYFVSEKDAGQAHAINKGFSHSTGEFFAWLNSDDIYHKGTVLEAADYLINHPSCDLVYGGVDVVDQDGCFLRQDEALPFSLERFLNDNLIAQPSAFFTKSGFDRVGGIDESLHFCMDYDLWLRLATLGSCKSIGKSWSRFRLHPTSKTTLLQARCWSEITQILTNWFDSQDVGRQHKLSRSQILGRANWIAALELSIAGERERAIEQINYAIRENPAFIGSRELSFLLVGDVAAHVTEKNLQEVEAFFSLIPNALTFKARALRQIMARAEALIALNDSTERGLARSYAWRALRRDKIWLRNRHLLSRAFLH